MSSKNAPDLGRSDSERLPARKSWSLAARLTIWNTGSSFLLILGATGFLYLALCRSLDREDDNQLADQALVLRDMLAERPDNLEAVRREAEEEFQSRQHTRVFIRLLDATGQTLVETPEMDRVLASDSFPVPVLAPETGIDRRSPEGISFRIMSVRFENVSPGKTFVVQAAMDRTQEVELLDVYRKNLWLILVTALALCAIIGHIIARRGLQPLRMVADTANRIKPSNLGERIEANGLPAELFTLAGTFNTMLDRLEQSFIRLSRFSADIAHELRTPVNNLRGEIEVALGHPRQPGEYREVLGSNLEECGRLSRMIDSLLFLARAENPRTQVFREQIDIGTELTTIRDFYEAAANEKGVGLSVSADGRFPADLNRSLFQRAIGNLISNAVAHTPPGGTVTLAVTGDDTTATVEVTDTGDGIPADALPHVFDRFFRADQARSSSSENVGLGLAIVKSIVELHGGTIHISSEVGRGTRVTVHFPRRMTKP
ncbi:heavy metal sensor histidine kinase [Zavarzinella formosa]|uniref:heavy metal sensor histidine kinase n=1 Tax=Zavarzinella formosa TaxID=360055 RepID=UPI0002E44AE9|nr:heavy metal sensor histidine kinase [Zavarzinella formosa]